MEYELRNRIVLITGGAKGIGAHIADALLAEGVKHVSFLDVLEQEGIKRQETLSKKYGADKVKCHKCDVTQEEQLFAAYQFVLDNYGSIDIVLNNAGIVNDKVYKKEIDINVTATVTSTFKAIELMRKDNGGKGGVIVNTSSVAAITQSHTLPVYFGTKSFILQFSTCIGLPDYFNKTGVRVLTMCYGKTATTLLDANNISCYDTGENGTLLDLVKSISAQKAESAAMSVIAACKRGESGSTWLAQADTPAQDITAKVQEAHKILTDLLL